MNNYSFSSKSFDLSDDQPDPPGLKQTTLGLPDVKSPRPKPTATGHSGAESSRLKDTMVGLPGVESQRLKNPGVGLPGAGSPPATSSVLGTASPKSLAFSYESFTVTEDKSEPQRLSQSMTVLPMSEAQVTTPVSARHRVVRYMRLHALGAGGVGEVDLWHDQDIDRDVAVKRLKHAGSPESLASFVHEIRTTGQLEHPGIVPLYDVGQDEQGRYFFVMKHIEGETLEQIIARLRANDAVYAQRFSPEVCTQIFMQILRSVQYAHKKGFIHCDIKPANVIVGPFGEVMMLDWGLAQRPRAAAAPAAGDRAVRPVSLRGTPDYMAPEQAMGEQAGVDARTDTYCLCILFYELITRHYYLSPVRTVQARLASVIAEEPLSALQLHHKYGAPPELTNFIRYGLAKDPAQRYQTVDEMIDKLQAVIDGEIPVVCPCTGVKRFAHAYSGLLNIHPIVGIAVLCVAALLTLFGLFELVRLGLFHH